VSVIPPLSADRARAIVGAMARARLLVVGDAMLDHFIVGSVSRISPEAPVPVVRFEREEHRAGGAANVAMNARALGARVALVGLVGADAAAGRLRDLLDAAGIEASGLVTDARRRTTTKSRIVTTRNQQVARIDYETDETPPAAIDDALVECATARMADVDVVVVSDYLKGAVTRNVMAALVGAARARGIPLLIDPKIPHLDLYAGATLVTPNQQEAETAAHLRIRTEEEARRAAALFRERARCEGVLITRGEHGMWLSCDGIEGALPASAREVADVTGAGDTVVAALALALASGARPAEAARLANEAAGIVVGKFGAATDAREEHLARI
jgi:D-beta-D-heptose 7-phosphate kinase/D-beta-D-heptose 1-phosphate adenosyltransferase